MERNSIIGAETNILYTKQGLYNTDAGVKSGSSFSI